MFLREMESRVMKVLAYLASRATDWVILALAGLVFAAPVAAQDTWPAEAIRASTNLTAIEGPGENDFHSDLSAAVWNPVTRTLWLGRNGPGGANSKLWAVVEDGDGSFEIDSRAGSRGEWTNFGALEGVTQANFQEDVVYLMIEGPGEERIKEYDVSTYGTAIQNNDWNTRSFLPRDGGSGAEGITFVPDSALLDAGFVDQNGTSYELAPLKDATSSFRASARPSPTTHTRARTSVGNRQFNTARLQYSAIRPSQSAHPECFIFVRLA
jgi:hypothetical protein